MICLEPLFARASISFEFQPQAQGVSLQLFHSWIVSPQASLVVSLRHQRWFHAIALEFGFTSLRFDAFWLLHLFAINCVEFTFHICTSCAPHCIAALALQWEGIAGFFFGTSRASITSLFGCFKRRSGQTALYCSFLDHVWSHVNVSLC